MKQKTIFIILAICGLSFAVVMLLFAMSEPISSRQHFSRSHKLDYVTLEEATAVERGYYIAGEANGQFYFGNENDPLELMVTDVHLKVVERFRLPLTSSGDLKDSRIQVDTSGIYLKAGNLPGVFKYLIADRQKYTFQPLPYFERAVPISSTAYILQVRGNEVGAGITNNLLFAVSTRSTVSQGVIKLSNDVEGYFASQGVLRYCKDLHRLVYTHYYHNRIMVMDTSLNVLYEGRTLDTLTRANVKPVEIKEGHYSLASVSAVVNRNAQISGKSLFVHSGILGMNDDPEAFERSSLLDVYDIESMQYRFSFYLPHYHEQEMKTFGVFDNRVIALYPSAIAVYTMERSQ